MSEAGHGLSRLEREKVYVENVVRQSIQKISLMLSEDIAGLTLADINICIEMLLSRFAKILGALQRTE